MAVGVDLNPILRRQYQLDYDSEKGLVLDDGAGVNVEVRLYIQLGEAGLLFQPD
jgi:hypothetical protein